MTDASGAGPDGGGAPGVLTVLPGDQALAVVLGYAVLAAAVALVVSRRRDLA